MVVKAAVSQLGTQDETAIYIQSFDPEEVKYLSTLTTGNTPPVQLIQGINPGKYAKENIEHYSYDLLFTRFGIRSLASYTYAITVVSTVGIAENTLPRLIEDAKTLQMKIFLPRSVSASGDKSAEGEQTPQTSQYDGFITADPAQLKETLKNRWNAEYRLPEDMEQVP